MTRRPADSNHPARIVHLGSEFQVRNAQSSPTAGSESLSVLEGEKRQDRPLYDPAFHQEASLTSTLFWSFFGVGVVASCVLFFVYT